MPSLAVSSLLNAAQQATARALLTNCCAAPAWVEGMLHRRPFADDAAVLQAAETVAASLDEADWLAAFAAHPRIGDVESLRAKYAATKLLAAGEQSGVAAADEETLAELARLNQAYVARFDFIFIVCATGKTARQMLEILRGRIDNDRETELRLAAAEQMKITRLRIEKLAVQAPSI